MTEAIAGAAILLAVIGWAQSFFWRGMSKIHEDFGNEMRKINVDMIGERRASTARLQSRIVLPPGRVDLKRLGEENGAALKALQVDIDRVRAELEKKWN